MRSGRAFSKILRWSLPVVLLPFCGYGQFSITVRDLFPASARGGYLYANGTGNQAGMITPQGGFYEQAGCWSNTAGSFVNLHPQAKTASAAHAATATEQGGYYYTDLEGYRAVIWSGSTNSMVILHPPGATQSEVRGMIDGQQAGYGLFGGLPHAGLWSGSSNSFVDLHPAGASESSADSIDPGQQAGYARFNGANHAGFWSSSSNSYIDLHPAGAADSQASATRNGQQAGFATIGGNAHAGIWSGSSNSFVDLHPAGAMSSRVRATTGSAQAGSIEQSPFTPLAAMWFGSAASYSNLHAILGNGYFSSVATGICTNGNTIEIAGYAYDNFENVHPLLWILTPVPNLNIGLSGTYVFLSWSTNATDFRLERTPQVWPTSWSTVTNPTLTANGSFVVVLPAGSQREFFRLAKL